MNERPRRARSLLLQGLGLMVLWRSLAQAIGACRFLSPWKVNIKLAAEKQDKNGSKDRKDEARSVKSDTFSRSGKHVRHSAAEDRTDDAEHYSPD